MNVQPVKISNPSFGTCARHYGKHSIKNFSSFAEPIIRTSTHLFRNDLSWEALTKYVIKHFNNKSMVQTFSLACSDGSEAYSYAITMLNKLPDDELKKFLPIKSVDIDPEIIKVAKTGRINLADFEFDSIENWNLKLENFFTKQSKALDINNDKLGIDPTHSYQVVGKLRDCVDFKVGEILSEINNMKDEGNSVVMCRNVFPYLKEEYISKVLSAVNQNLKSGSLFITGCYDERVKISDRMLKNGFFNPIAKERYIFQKR